jgi:ribosomal protein S12 methylthiotransferase accessory factor
MPREVIVTFPGGKRVDALVDGRLVHTDQPTGAGGENSAPAPFDLFAASLGTCAGYFVLAFCQARSLSTDGIILRQRIGFDEAHVLRDVEVEIEVPPSFPERYRSALARAAEGCTVKKAIEAQPRFAVRTVMSGAQPPPSAVSDAGQRVGPSRARQIG